jgi:Tol biopolymer transport system component
MVSLSDRTEQQVTVGDTSYVQPDMAQGGRLFASRVRMESDIWRFPVMGSPTENTTRAERITRQTGQVQTPSVSPDGTEIVYLSDSGGHSNVWVASTDGSSTRQITFERDPEVIIGIPQWSPVGDRIVYIITSDDGQFEWLINPDGSGQTRLAEGRAANWSWDGRWVYFTSPADQCIDRVPVTGGPVERVRCSATGPIIAPDGETLFFRPSLEQDNELFKATPPGGPAELVASYPESQIPAYPTGYALSPDGRWIAVPLKEARATNIWAIPTDGGPFRQITDFADRSTLITRQVSWSADGQSIYAAVVDNDADVVLLDGLTAGARD